MATITRDQINNFQSEFLSAGNLADNTATFCRENPKDVIAIVRDAAGWAGKFFSDSAVHFGKINDTLDTVNDGFSFTLLPSDMRNFVVSAKECLEKGKSYFGYRGSATGQPVTFSNVTHKMADLVEDGANLVSDGCDALKCANEIEALNLAEHMSTIKSVGSGAGMISTLKGIYDHGISLYKMRNEPEPASSEIEHQLADLDEKNHWGKLAQNIAYFALCFFSFVSVVASVTISSTMMLFLSSVALTATVACFFIKENSHQMQKNLLGRVVHEID